MTWWRWFRRCISRGRPCWRCCTTTSGSRTISRKRCCWRRRTRAGGWLMRCCPRFTPRGPYDLAYLFSTVYWIWLYASRAGGVPGAVAEHHDSRRISAAKTHELNGRCAVARHSPRCGGGLSGERHVAAGDDCRRLYRRDCGGADCRLGQPSYAAEGGCQLCRILPWLAGAGRHAGVAARLKRRPAASAVWLHSGRW